MNQGGRELEAPHNAFQTCMLTCSMEIAVLILAKEHRPNIVRIDDVKSRLPANPLLEPPDRGHIYSEDRVVTINFL